MMLEGGSKRVHGFMICFDGKDDKTSQRIECGR